jgi:hypothetical protein
LIFCLLEKDQYGKIIVITELPLGKTLIEHLHPSFEAPPQQIESSTLQPPPAGQCHTNIARIKTAQLSSAFQWVTKHLQVSVSNSTTSKILPTGSSELTTNYMHRCQSLRIEVRSSFHNDLVTPQPKILVVHGTHNNPNIYNNGQDSLM